MYSVCQAVGATDITLLYVASVNHFAILADPRQKHFHLRYAGVLRFIEYHKGFAVKGFTAHKRQGRCNYPSMPQTIIYRSCAEPLVENIAKGINVYGKFLVHTTG